MKALVIGSKGFIGSHVTKYLLEKKHEVYEADIVHEYGNPYYSILAPNASDYEFEEIFKLQQFDVCVNCSGAAVVKDSFTNPLRDYQLNTLNVYRMLNSLRIHNPNCRFITLSSAAVYGNPEKLPVSENQKLQPLSPYGFHKMQSEEICRNFHQLYELNSVVLRIFSAYGPGLKKQLFWDLNQKAKDVDSVDLPGDGEETRDFIHVGDICRLIEIIIKAQLTGFKIFNVASGQQSKIKDVVYLYYNLLGFDGDINFSKKSLPGYPSKWQADISSLHQHFSFETDIDLESGLFDYVSWIKKYQF